MAPLLVESVTLRYDTMGNSPRWEFHKVLDNTQVKVDTVLSYARLDDISFVIIFHLFRNIFVDNSLKVSK